MTLRLPTKERQKPILKDIFVEQEDPAICRSTYEQKHYKKVRVTMDLDLITCEE